MASLGYTIAAGRILITVILLLLAVLGNYLGNLRPNYFVGIRTPWTLEDPDTWRATHRLSARLICFGVIVLAVLQFLLSPGLFALLFCAAILLLLLWCFLYSWRYFQSHAANR